jgi:hypothetical protein
MADDAFEPGKSLGQRLKHVFGLPEWTETESVPAAREVRRPGAVPYDPTHLSPVPCHV